MLDFKCTINSSVGIVYIFQISPVAHICKRSNPTLGLDFQLGVVDLQGGHYVSDYLSLSMFNLSSINYQFINYAASISSLASWISQEGAMLTATTTIINDKCLLIGTLFVFGQVMLSCFDHTLVVQVED